MLDREKVTKDLESIRVCCKNRQNNKVYDEIDREMFTDWIEIIDDALAMLKEQEDKIRQLRLALQIMNGNGIRVDTEGR